ncbi:MAG: hypothetical protein ACFFCZ_29800 [Promethearchaeota archaeon]
MGNRKIIYGYLLTVILLSITSLTASQVTCNTIDPPVLFSDKIKENMILQYNVTEFQTREGSSTGKASLGSPIEDFMRGGDSWFWGENISLSEGDVINIKVDSRDDEWEQRTGDSSLLYTSWWYGFWSYGPECNVTLFPGGTAPSLYADYELNPLFSRMAILPLKQKLLYPPNDGQDHSNTMTDMFGPHDANGTIDPGSWNGTGSTLRSNATYDWNSTYYRFYDSEGFKPLAYLKIPATFSYDTALNTTLAHWNYTCDTWFARPHYAGQGRMVSYMWAFRLWPFPPLVNVVTDIQTGIAQSMEFYFGNDSAWTMISIYNQTVWRLLHGTGFWLGDVAKWEPHILAKQVEALKLDLLSVSYGLPSPGFEAVFVFVGMSLTALAVFFYRKRKYLRGGIS